MASNYPVTDEDMPHRTLCVDLYGDERLVVVSKSFLENFRMRTYDGYAVSAKWGEQNPDGTYTPVFSIDHKDYLGPEM